MKLIIATPSPFARKIRIVLREKSIPCDEVIDTPWNTDSFASDHSPLAKIPILIADDGTKIFDSRVIVEYIESMPNSVQLLPKKNQGTTGQFRKHFPFDSLSTEIRKGGMSGSQAGGW